MKSDGLLSLQNLVTIGATAALLAAIGCGDSTSDNAGGNATGGGGEQATGGNVADGGAGGTGGIAATGGGGSDGGAGGVGGSGGSGGGPNLPELEQQVVGTPDWEPVDFHEFSVEVGAQFSNFGNVISGLFPPPNHAPHDDLGVGPGEPHAGPYDDEFATNVAAQGYVDTDTFAQADVLLPNAVMVTWMLVPTASAPTGSSPDFETGPIMPNTIFPMTVTFEVWQDDVMLDGYAFSFDVPPLDDQLDPPFDVEGHSHIPIFNAVVFDGADAVPGTLEMRSTVRDANDEGYDLVMHATAE